MSTTTRTLFSDVTGRICCADHAPRRGSDTWNWHSWRAMTRREVREWLEWLQNETGDRSVDPCEECRWAKGGTA